MIVYSYPFRNNKDWNKFWSCFDDVSETIIMEVKSSALINNKFCKAKVYYRTGTFNRNWKNVAPDGRKYNFQIGEHENVHGHFINCDITDLPYQSDTSYQQVAGHHRSKSPLQIILDHHPLV